MYVVVALAVGWAAWATWAANTSFDTTLPLGPEPAMDCIELQLKQVNFKSADMDMHTSSTQTVHSSP